MFRQQWERIQSNQEKVIKPFRKIWGKDILYLYKIKRVASNKWSLLLKIDLGNTQTLQLNWNGNYLQKYLRDQAKKLGFVITECWITSEAQALLILR